ncbi:MAG: DUF2330 domain-containing protein [Fimbriimonadaceae bacterium]|nr:DUF2330 domain-containing protein [Fimbriimonadaceae bacterium]
MKTRVEYHRQTNMKSVARSAVFGTFALSSVIAAACCIAYGENKVELAGERAIIVWNSKTKMQHFIRTAKFEGQAKDFGFIVPTPTEPEISKAEMGALTKLDTIKAREKKASRNAVSLGGGGFGGGRGVTEVKKVNIGNYEATVLKATDPKAMTNWLRTNGYNARPAVEEWVSYYTKQGWYFSAFKYTGGTSTRTETTLVRLSFKTDVPHYPYKMPSDTWPNGHVRPMELFVITDQHIHARYKGVYQMWEARQTVLTTMTNAEKNFIADQVGLKASDMPEKAELFVFDNNQNKYGFDKDLVFIKNSTNLDPQWLWLLCIPAAMVVVWRQRKP